MALEYLDLAKAERLMAEGPNAEAAFMAAEDVKEAEVLDSLIEF